MLTYKAEGALRFLNRKYYEHGNKASRLLAFQLRKNQSNRIIGKIKCNHTSQILTQPNDITKTFAEYYKKLYEEQSMSEKREKVESFLRPIKMTKLRQEDADKLTSSVTQEEIRKSILKLKNGKTPGVDGLPGEYYKIFINELTPVLCKVYNYALTKGDPPGSWSEAIITVLPKENKDPTLCSSYRPISLLCVDMKILTSIIATRLQKYIKSLVKPDQTGFITNRQGCHNVRRALNLQAIAMRRKTPALFLGLDAEKAFDRVDWLFLEQSLKHMGFTDLFIGWIKIFYKNPKSRVRVNGHCSDFFPLRRGARQGDGLSPCLFILSIEPLAELIRADPHIQGIRDDANIQHKLALFADDILLFIENPITSIPVLLQRLNEYSSASGYKVNINKSELMMIVGNWPTELDTVVTFKKSGGGFRYLGVHLTPKPAQLFAANYTKLLQEVNKDLNKWDILPLSLFGRIESIKMNILPRFCFYSNICPS